MTCGVQTRRRLRSPGGVRVLVCLALLLSSSGSSEPVRPDHNKRVSLGNGLELPVVTASSTCLPHYADDLRHFEDPSVEPLLKAIDAAMRAERKRWTERIGARSNPADLLAEARKQGGDAEGLASLSLFLASANTAEAGVYTGVRGKRLRRQSDEAIAALDSGKHAWLKALPTDGARPIALPDWEKLLNEPEALTGVYESLGFGTKFPTAKQRGLVAWRELAAKEPPGDKKDFPGLELRKLGLFRLSVLRERLLTAFEEESESAFAVLEGAKRPDNIPDGQSPFPVVVPGEGGLTGPLYGFAPAAKMDKNAARDRRAFERRWACHAEGPSVIARAATDFVARYTGEASKQVGKLKEKTALHGLYDKHPRFGMPMAYRRALVENARGFDPAALLTEIDSILSAKDEGKFLETAGRTGLPATWILATLLNGAGSPLADVWTLVRNAIHERPKALPPVALEKESRVIAAKEARERRAKEREKALSHLEDSGSKLGRPFAPAEIARLKKLSDDEFDRIVDVFHAASGIHRSDPSWLLMFGDFVRKFGSLPVRGSSQLLGAIQLSEKEGLKFDPKKLKTFELFPPPGEKSERSAAANDWLDRANVAIVDHFQAILDDEMARLSQPDGKRPRKTRSEFFAVFDEAFAARYGESLTDRVCGKPAKKEACDAAPSMEEYLAIARFLGMAELALEDEEVIFHAGDRGKKPSDEEVVRNVLHESDWAMRRLRALEAYEDRCASAADKCGKETFGKEREALFKRLYADAETSHLATEARIRELADSKDKKNAPELRKRLALAKAYELRLRALEGHLFGHHAPDERARTEIGFDWPGFLDGKGGDTGATLTLSCSPDGEHKLKGVPSKYVGSTRALVNWVRDKSIDDLIVKAGLLGSRAAIKAGAVRWSVLDAKLKDAAGGDVKIRSRNVGCRQADIDRMRLKVAYLMLKRQHAELDSYESGTGFYEATRFLESYFGTASVRNVEYESVPPDIKALASDLQKLSRAGKRSEIEAVVDKLKTGTAQDKAKVRKLLVFFQPFYRRHLARQILYATTVPLHVAEAAKTKPELRLLWESLPIDVQQREHARAFVGLLKRDETPAELHARLKPIADMEARRRNEANGGEPPKPPESPATREDDVLVVHGPFVSESIRRFVKPFVRAASDPERDRLKSGFVPPYEYIDEYFAKKGETAGNILSLEQARAFFLWELLKARRIRDGKPLPQAGEHAKELAGLVDAKKPETLRQLVAALEHMVLTLDRKIEARGGAPTNRSLASIPPGMVLDDALLHLERAWLRLLNTRAGNPRLKVNEAIFREYGKTWALFRNTLENHGRSRFTWNDDGRNQAGVVDTKRVSSDTAIQGLEDCEIFLLIHDAGRKHPSFQEALRDYRGGEVNFGGLSLRSRNALENLPPALRQAVNVWCHMDWNSTRGGIPEFKWDRFAERSVSLAPENARAVADVILNPYPPTKIVRLLVHNETLRKAYFDDVEDYLSQFERTLKFACKDMDPDQEKAAERLSRILRGRGAEGPFKKALANKKQPFGVRGIFENVTQMTRVERDAYRRWAQEELLSLSTSAERASMDKKGGMEALAQKELRRMHSAELVNPMATDCARKFDPLKHYLALMVVALDEFGDGNEESTEDEVRLEAVKGGVLRFAPSHVVGLYRDELKVFGRPKIDDRPKSSEDVKEMVREFKALEERAAAAIKKVEDDDPSLEAWKNVKYFAFLLDQAFLRVDRRGLLEFGPEDKAHAAKELAAVWAIFRVDMRKKPFPPEGMKELKRLLLRAHQAVGKPDPFEELDPKPKPVVAVPKSAPRELTSADKRRTVTPEAKKELERILTALGYPNGKSGFLKRLADKPVDKMDFAERKALADELDELGKRATNEKLVEGLGDAAPVADGIAGLVARLRHSVSPQKQVLADGRRASRYFALAGVGDAARRGGVKIDAPLTLSDLLAKGSAHVPSGDDLKKYREALVEAVDGLEKDPEVAKAFDSFKYVEELDPAPLAKELATFYKAALAYVGDEKSGWLSKDNVKERWAKLTQALSALEKHKAVFDKVLRSLPLYNADRRPWPVQIADAKARLAEDIDQYRGPLTAQPPLRVGEWKAGDETAYDAYAKELGVTADAGLAAEIAKLQSKDLTPAKRAELEARLDKLDATYLPELRGRLAMQAPSVHDAMQRWRRDARRLLKDPESPSAKTRMLQSHADLVSAHGELLKERAKRPKEVPVAAAPAAPSVPLGPPAPEAKIDPDKGTIPDAVRQQVEDIQSKLHEHGKSLTGNQRLAIAGRDRQTNKLLLELYEPMVHALPKQGMRGTKELWLRLAQSGGPKDILDARQLLAPALDRVRRGDVFDPIAARNLVRRRIREAGVVDGNATEELRKLADHRFHATVLPERLKAIFGDAHASADAMAVALEALKTTRERQLIEISAQIERDLREEIAQEIAKAYRAKLAADRKKKGKEPKAAEDEATSIVDTLISALLLTGDEKELPETGPEGRRSAEVLDLWKKKVALAKEHQAFLKDVRKALGADPKRIYREAFAKTVEDDLAVAERAARRFGVSDDGLEAKRFLRSEGIPRFHEAYDAAIKEGLAPHDAYAKAQALLSVDGLFATRRKALDGAFERAEHNRFGRWDGATGTSARRNVAAAVTNEASATQGLGRWCDATADKHWASWLKAKDDALKRVRNGEGATRWTAFQAKARKAGDLLLARQAEIGRKMGELKQEVTRVRRTLEHLKEVQKRSEWRNKSVTPERERTKVLELEARLGRQLPVLEAEMRAEAVAMDKQNALIIRQQEELAVERAKLVRKIGEDALNAANELGSRDQRVKRLAGSATDGERPPDLATRGLRAKALDRYFELRERAADLGAMLAESGKPFSADEPGVVALATSASQEVDGCPVAADRVRELVKEAHAAATVRIAARRKALDALAVYGIHWNGASIDFSGFKVDRRNKIDGAALKKLFEDVTPLLPYEGGSPVEAAMAQLLRPSPWQMFEADLQGRWSRFGRLKMFEYTKTPGADEGAAVKVTMKDGAPVYEFTNLSETRAEGSKVAEALRALARKTPEKMQALQTESNHTLWFFYDPESKREDVVANVNLIRQKMAQLEDYGAIGVSVHDGGGGPSIPLPATMVSFHAALELRHGTYHALDRMAAELNEDWWWRLGSVGVAVAVIAAAALTGGLAGAAAVPAMLSAAATGAGVGLASAVIETDLLPKLGFESARTSWSDRGPELLKTIGVFALGSGLGQVFEGGLVASTTAGRSLMSVDALAAGTITRAGAAKLGTSPIFAHMRGMFYASMLIDLSLAAKDVADGYDFSLKDFGKIAFHAGQTAFYVWGPDQRLASLATNYWARFAMSFATNSMLSLGMNGWSYKDQVDKARNDLRTLEERKRAEGKDPEKDEEVLEARKQVDKIASWREFGLAMLRSQLTEAAGHAWFARAAAKHAGHLTLQRDLARLADAKLAKGDTPKAIADRLIREEGPDLIDRWYPFSEYNQRRRRGESESPLQKLAKEKGREEIDRLLDEAAKNPGGKEAKAIEALAAKHSGGDPKRFATEWADFRDNERNEVLAGALTQMPQWQIHQLVESKTPEAQQMVELLAAQYGLTTARFRSAWKARTASTDFKRLAPLGGPDAAAHQLVQGNDDIPRRAATEGEKQRQGAALLATAEKAIDEELAVGPQWAKREELMGELLVIRPDRVSEYRFDLLADYLKKERKKAVGDGARMAIAIAARDLGVRKEDNLLLLLRDTQMPRRFGYEALGELVRDLSGANPARQVAVLEARKIAPEVLLESFGEPAFKQAARRLYTHRGIGAEDKFEDFYKALAVSMGAGKPAMQFFDEKTPAK